MVLRIFSEPAGAELLNCLMESHKRKDDWSSNVHKKTKNLLKSYLFDIQESRCSYCQRDIKDEDGHVEIDHILPKSERGRDAALKSSNDRNHRRRTAGYIDFAFNLYNLALTCKRCNNRKGSYDCRRNRADPTGPIYNLDSDQFEWVHPHLDQYEDHIDILGGLVFQVKNSSKKGDALIYACRLDKISAVEANARMRIIRRSKDYKEALSEMMRQYKMIGWPTIIDEICVRFPDIPRKDIEGTVENIMKNFQ